MKPSLGQLALTRSARFIGLLAVLVLLVALGIRIPRYAGATVEAQTVAQTRTYFIAADEVNWDYAPLNFNNITGQPFGDEENTFVQSGPDRIGKVYRKAIYREYTDGTFTRLKTRSASEQHLGLLGPVIRAQVGDTIVVNFKNNSSFPASIHPHGVFYNKNGEGAPYNDGTSGANKADDAVPTGGRVTYTWQVPDRAGPGPGDSSSVVWMYHSHTDEVADTYSGLIGAMVITARGKARSDGSPVDVDRELFTLFEVMDENQSHYLDYNIQHFTGDPSSVDPEDEGFHESNLMHSINGYVYGNLLGLTAQRGQRVRWYVIDLGTEVDQHTPHWHGNTGLTAGPMGMRSDMLALMPGDMKVLNMTPDDPGTWLFHCHVNDHILAGMLALYTVQ